MKKILGLLLLFVSVFTLAACGTKAALEVNEADKTVALEVGEDKTITLVKSSGTVEWATSNSAVATVLEGKITAVSAGSAVITVSIKDSDLKVDINVTVSLPDVESVSVSGASEVVLGTTANYTSIVTPALASQAVTWSTSSTSVATIDATGKLTPVSAGTVKVIATSSQDQTVKFELNITVILPDPSGITITGDENVILGEDATYVAVVNPELAVQTVVWSVDDTSVATIDATGKLTPVSAGTVVITATSTAKDTVKATKTVTIAQPAVEAVSISGPASIFQGTSGKYTASVTPTNAVQTIVWSVNDTNIATIDQEGKLTAVAAGTVKVIATSLADATKKFELDVTVAKLNDNFLIDPEIEEKAVVVYKQETFVQGLNAFASLGELAGKLKADSIVYLKAGTYTDPLTVSVNNVKLIGPNQGINAVTGSRVDEAIIKAKITISGVDGFTLDGVSLQGAGQLFAATAVKNIEILNIYGYDHSVDAAQGVIFFGLASATDKNENIEVLNSSFNDSKGYGYRGVRINNASNLTIKDNYFYGFFDTIRLEGNGNAATGHGVNGYLVIEDNKFEMNIQYPIMVSKFTATSVEINNNHIAVNPDGTGTYGFIYLNGYAPQAGVKTLVNIKYNFMPYNTAWHEIRLNSGGATAEQLEVNVNYNTFSETPIIDGTTQCKHIADHNTTVTNFKINGRENVYLYSEDVIADYFLRTDFEPFYRDHELVGASYVNPAWASTENGATVTYNSLNLVFGQNAFASLTDAYNAAVEGAKIYLVPGTYSDSLTINKNNITILSGNYKLDPNSAVRSDEAILTGTITLAANLKDFTLKGLKFINEAKIINVVGSAGTSSNVATNINGFKFMYNVVETNLASGKGFIYFVEAGSSYSRNLEFSYNKFSTTNASTTLDSVIYIDNNAGLRVIGNVFENIKVNAFYVNDATKGLAGESYIQGNLFKSVEGNALKVNWLSPLPGTTMTFRIVDNRFENVSGDSIYIGSMNNADTIEGILIQYNTFNNINNGIFVNRVHANANFAVHYNIFETIPGGYYFKDAKTASAPVALNAINNFYMDNETVIAEPLAAKFEGSPLYTTKYTSLDQVPAYPGEGVVVIDSIELVEMEGFPYVGDTYQLEVTVSPDNAELDTLVWESSDETVATVSNGLVTFIKAGEATIKVYQEGNITMFDEVTLVVTEFTDIDINTNSRTGVLDINEEVQLTVVRYPNDLTGDATFTSLTPAVASVSATGLVKALTEGEVVIEVKVGGLTTTMTLIVKQKAVTIDPVKFIMDANINLALVRNINTFGSTTKTELTAGAVSNIWFNTLSMKEVLMAGRPKTKLTSLEFVVVHDTGNNNVGATAQMHSNYLVNNTSVSWHYTVDEKEAIRHIPHDEVGYHAGDGLREFGLNDTGVSATTPVPVITISSTGFYEFNGVASTIAAPLVNGALPKTSDITPDGLFTTIQEGKYFINNTYYNSTYKVIANAGGGTNGIGIESAVDQGSDLYATWQNLAQLVAYILDEESLGLDRVMHHNNFSGKNCPQTLRTANLTDQLREMIKFEYEKRTTYKDYTFSFVSNNPSLVDNSGKIIKIPDATTEVSYTVNITNNSGYSEAVTLYSTIPGIKTLG